MIDIRQGDCLAVIETLQDKSVDICFIDPPYNTKNKKNKAVKYDRNKDFERKNWKNFYSNWDDIDRYYSWNLRYLRAFKPKLKERGSILICGSFHNIPDVALALRKAGYYTIQWIQWCIPNAFPNLSMTKMINANQTIIWARSGKSHFYDKAYIKEKYTKNLRDYWIINNDTQAGKRWKHPSKKPVDLVRRALEIAYPKEGGLVVDFFAGSGTTGVAAKEFNADCILGDNSAEYVAMMKERLENDG